MSNGAAGFGRGSRSSSTPRFRLPSYGSYARGDETEESDIDLLVIVPKLDKGTLDLLLEVAWEVGFEAGVVFSVIPVAVEELEELAESPFINSQ